MYHIIYVCTILYTYEPDYIRMYHIIYACTCIHTYVPYYIRMYHIIYVCTRLYTHVLDYIRTYQIIYTCTRLYTHVPDYIGMYQIIHVCTVFVHTHPLAPSTPFSRTKRQHERRPASVTKSIATVVGGNTWRTFNWDPPSLNEI